MDSRLRGNDKKMGGNDKKGGNNTNFVIPAVVIDGDNKKRAAICYYLFGFDNRRFFADDGVFDIMPRMNSDNSGNQHSQTNPQTPVGAAQEGDNAPVFEPVFVGSVREYIRSNRAIIKANVHQWRRVRQSVHRCGGSLCFGFAVLYALIFAIAGVLFPKLYQAWLDFCMPLAEYVGGLTPRADRIMGQLTENGYPERADDALHGIAIARVLMVPVFICVVAGTCFAKYPLVHFVCTSQTRTKIRLYVYLVVFVAIIAINSLLPGFFVYTWEFVMDEGFDGHGSGYMSGIKDLLHGYHRGNLAMMLELLVMGLILFFVASVAMGFTALTHIRFTIVKQPPENKV